MHYPPGVVALATMSGEEHSATPFPNFILHFAPRIRMGLLPRRQNNLREERSDALGNGPLGSGVYVAVKGGGVADFPVPRRSRPLPLWPHHDAYACLAISEQPPAR